MTAKKSNTPVLSRDLWGTPSWLYVPLHEEFNFEIDAAADKNNALCPRFFTKEQNALTQIWDEPTFCNPPYSVAAGGTLKWVTYGYEQSQCGNVPVVFIVQGDTSTKYRRFALQYASEIRDLVHRVKFNGAPNTPPWPTAIYVFRPMMRMRVTGCANVSLWDYRGPVVDFKKL